MEKYTNREIVANENKGFDEGELLKFLHEYPRVVDLMAGEDLVFNTPDGIVFPSPVRPEDEKSDPELGSRAFRRRVAMHTTAVGLTTRLLLDDLVNAGAIDAQGDALNSAVEVMTLHDLYKVHEIRWRKVMGSSDRAYDAAEDQLAGLLRHANYDERDIELAGSIGHNGAKDFLLDYSAGLHWSFVRQSAYLADELLEETVIQKDPLAKVHRLQSDPRYKEANEVGFPELKGHPFFTFKDGSLIPKYRVQQEATEIMLIHLESALGIPDDNLGIHLIQRAMNENLIPSS